MDCRTSHAAGRVRAELGDGVTTEKYKLENYTLKRLKKSIVKFNRQIVKQRDPHQLSLVANVFAIFVTHEKF